MSDIIAASWDRAVSLASTYLPGRRDFAACTRSHCIGTRRRKWDTSFAKAVSCAGPTDFLGFVNFEGNAAVKFALGRGAYANH
jgi:hypothetical protein